MANYDRIDWVNEAVGGIVSPKERAAARQELLDHMDDHTEALMATGLPRSRALEQACAAMGDPKAVGKHLRRVHQPVLTRLLQVMRGVLILLVCLAALRTLICLTAGDPPLPSWLCGNPQKALDIANEFCVPPEAALQDMLLARRVLRPEVQIPAEDYSVTVHSAAVSQYDDGYCVVLILDFTAHSLLQDGPVFTQNLLLQSGEELQEYFPDTYRASRNLRHHYVFVYRNFPHDPQRVCLTYPAEEGGFSMEIDLKGGWDYEKGN